MRKSFYFLAPVEVVKVTTQNLSEVAEWCGGQVQETESRKYPGRMDSYVWVPTPKGSTVSWAFPGMYVTKRLVATVKGELKTTWAVFRRDYFEKNYFEDIKDAVDKTWELEDRRPKEKETVVVVNQNFDAKQFEQAVSDVKADVAKLAVSMGVDLEETVPTEVPKEAVEKAVKESKAEVAQKPIEQKIEEPKPVNQIVFTKGENSGPTAVQEAMARAKKAPKIIQG